MLVPGHTRGRLQGMADGSDYTLNLGFSFGAKTAENAPLEPHSHSHHFHHQSASFNASDSPIIAPLQPLDVGRTNFDQPSLAQPRLGIRNPFVTPLDPVASNTSSLSLLLGTLPVLVALPSVLLSAKMAFSETDQTNGAKIAGFGMLFFLSGVFLLLTEVLVRTNVVSLSQRAEMTPRDTAAVLVAVGAVLAGSRLLLVARVSVLLLGLYFHQWNPYTAIAFIYDAFLAWESFGDVVGVIAGYAFVFGGFWALKGRLSAPSSLDPVILTSLVATSGLMVAFFGWKSVSLSMVGVNAAASLVWLISLQDSHVRVPHTYPVLMGFLAFLLQYVVLPTELNFGSVVVGVFLPAIISVDRSQEIAVSEGVSNPKGPAILRELLSHSDTRAIFNFLLLNSAFMFVQFLYSFRSKSLGLLLDSLHMALDCASLALGLVAGILLKNPIDANGKFPFGLRNFEILAGFTNGALLVGISGSIIFEAVGRLFNPVSLQKTNELIVVSTLGLLVNLVGIFAFHDHGHSHGHSHSHSNSHSHSHGHSHASSHESGDMNDNMKGIFLHIMADTLGSVGVVASTILTKFFVWEGFDPVASIIIAVLIFASAVPLIKSSASTLLLKLNTEKENKVRAILNDITTIKGIKSFTTPRFWPSSDGCELNGYIHIQIYRGENGPHVKRQCEKMFAAENIGAMIQVENDYDDCWCRT